MRKYVHHLRTHKTDIQKKQIAFGVSSLFMVGIIGIWAATFSVRFPGLLVDNRSYQSTDTNAEPSLSVQDSLRQQFSAGAGYSDPEIQAILNDSSNVEISSGNSGSSNNTISISDVPAPSHPPESGYYGDNDTVIISDPQN